MPLLPRRLHSLWRTGEQAVADQRLGAATASERPGHLAEYELAHAGRDEGTMSRAATAAVRTLVSAERDAQADRRDESAHTRDMVAAERDQVAEVADHQAETLARGLGELDSPAKAALDAAASARSLAAAARTKAATDRRRAARDRDAAARDRDFGRGEMERSQLDELTGAYRRGMGEVLLRHEMARAARVQGKLVLVFIDADGLKETNARAGHAAGDTLLCHVHSGLQARLRPYDPIVRWGGDEFVCAVSGVSLEEARDRIEEALRDLEGLDPSVSVTYGLAAMEAGDTLAELIGRADAAQRKAKEAKHS